MTPEVGHFLLIMALVLTMLQVFLPIFARGSDTAVLMTRLVTHLQCVCVAAAFTALLIAFVTDDFSVAYVANNSHTEMPLPYKISAVWGAHEGSLVLWLLMLSLWSSALSCFSKRLPLLMVGRILAVLGAVNIGFLLFTLLTSNPFLRLLVLPPEGRELNPLLQDPGLAIHPPLLYMGYVGFSVTFAFAMTALWAGQVDRAWAGWLRPWANAAWLFLTLGITLGSWWAYYELGWGGWWFWDPVENVSFMPWLSGTALLHCLAVVQTRGVFLSWTVLLSIVTFSLSLLGTFIVRSGVLVSVHAFAYSPERGFFIFLFLAVVVGGALLLFALRMQMFRRSAPVNFISREGGILINNLLLSSALVSVLLGTLYPLILDALNVGKISVGPPYYNRTFVPLMVPLIAVAGLGACLRWKRDTLTRLSIQLSIPAAIAIAAGVTLPWLLGDYDYRAAIGLSLSLWVALATGRQLLPHGRFYLPPLSGCAMMVAHLGLAVFIAGATVVSVYSIEKDVRMVPQQQLKVGEYGFVFSGVEDTRVENYRTQIGSVQVFRHGREVAILKPEKRYYVSQQQPLTEAAIDAGLWRDLYVALGEPLGDGAWSVRLQIKPLVRWLWAGALLMALGAGLAVLSRVRK